MSMPEGKNLPKRARAAIKNAARAPVMIGAKAKVEAGISEPEEKKVVPRWARAAIKQAARTATTIGAEDQDKARISFSSNRKSGDDLLIIQGGIGRMNGVVVARSDKVTKPSADPGEVAIWELPGWAQRRIAHDRSLVYALIGTDLLQFKRNGDVLFNGGRVKGLPVSKVAEF